MILSLPSSDQGEKTTAESVTSSHQAKLARLMWAAYQGTVDYDGETLEEATKEIEHTFEGGYGALLSDCSFVISDESDQLLISAILITLYQDAPLLAFSMTHPDYKRQGYGRILVREAMAALTEAEYSEVYLSVNCANEPALGLYRSFGFRDVEE
ncbi:MAG: GNAT family N-acetyltransferase [Planctomycetota bacterium]|nr:GNAT family N-acetyltransferase [Planctomycetota bacterium]